MLIIVQHLMLIAARMGFFLLDEGDTFGIDGGFGAQKV